MATHFETSDRYATPKPTNNHKYLRKIPCYVNIQFHFLLKSNWQPQEIPLWHPPVGNHWYSVSHCQCFCHSKTPVSHMSHIIVCYTLYSNKWEKKIGKKWVVEVRPNFCHYFICLLCPKIHPLKEFFFWTPVLTAISP